MTQCQDCGETGLRMCAINKSFCHLCCECHKPPTNYFDRRIK